MMPLRLGSKKSWFLLVLLFILAHGICPRRLSAYATKRVSSSIFLRSFCKIMRFLPDVHVIFSTSICIFSRIVFSRILLTCTPIRPMYGLRSDSGFANDFIKSSLSNVLCEYLSYAFFKRRIDCANFMFSHSLSS